MFFSGFSRNNPLRLSEQGEYRFIQKRGLYTGFLLVLLAAAYFATCKPRILLTVPLLLAVLISQINTNGRTFHEANKFNVHPKICAAISQDILQQILDADQAGDSEMILYVPYNVADPENEGNWPHS